MKSLRKLLKKKERLQDDLEQFAFELEECEGSYSEYLVAGEYDKTYRKLEKVNKKIDKLTKPESETEKQAARYRWLRDNKHLDAWWSVQGPKDRRANIDADIDNAMEEVEHDYNEKVEKWRHDSEELEAVHICLDDHNVPRTEGTEELSTWGRILRMLEPTKKH